MILSAKCPFCGNEVEADVFYVPDASGDYYSIEPLESFCTCDDRHPHALTAHHRRALILLYDALMGSALRVR